MTIPPPSEPPTPISPPEPGTPVRGFPGVPRICAIPSTEATMQIQPMTSIASCPPLSSTAMLPAGGVAIGAAYGWPG